MKTNTTVDNASFKWTPMFANDN